MTDDHQISDSEYASLSDQKAQDWRLISDVNPNLFAVAGALFAAGVAQKQAFVVALSPAPLFLAIWHMIRHARLQLQMVTYLEVFAPPGRASWERDIAAVRPLRWKREEEEKGRPWGVTLPSAVGQLLRTSAWNTWLGIAVVVSVLASAVPILSGYSSSGWAALLGFAVAVLGIIIVAWQANKIQSDREVWSRLWKEYKAERRSRATEDSIPAPEG